LRPSIRRGLVWVWRDKARCDAPNAGPSSVCSEIQKHAVSIWKILRSLMSESLACSLPSSPSHWPGVPKQPPSLSAPESRRKRTTDTSLNHGSEPASICSAIFSEPAIEKHSDRGNASSENQSCGMESCSVDVDTEQ